MTHRPNPSFDSQAVGPEPKPNQEGSLLLQDGRSLTWAEFGAHGGRPLLYFHGTLSSRLEAAALHVTSERLGLRLVAVDRPGVGGSTPNRSPSIAGFIEDIRQLLDTLGLEHAGLLGISSGGAYAAAVASHLPERITRLALVSSMCPPGAGWRESPTLRLLGWLARFTLLHLWLGAALMAFLVRRQGARLFREGARSPSEQRAMALPHHPDILHRAWVEGTRRGAKHVARDAQLVLRPWGVALASPDCPIDIWHGLDDPTVPPSAARWYAATFPHATLHVLAGEGHSLMVCRQEEVLAEFVG